MHLVLKLPSLYFSMIPRLLEEVEVSRPDIDRLLCACEAGNHARNIRARMSPIPQPPNIYYHYPLSALPRRMDHSLPVWVLHWLDSKIPAESFVDFLLREWKMPNLVSALLFLSVIIICLTDFLVPQNGGKKTQSTIAFIFVGRLGNVGMPKV